MTLTLLLSALWLSTSILQQTGNLAHFLASRLSLVLSDGDCLILKKLSAVVVSVRGTLSGERKGKEQKDHGSFGDPCQEITATSPTTPDGPPQNRRRSVWERYCRPLYSCQRHCHRLSTVVSLRPLLPSPSPSPSDCLPSPLVLVHCFTGLLPSLLPLFHTETASQLFGGACTLNDWLTTTTTTTRTTRNGRLRAPTKTTERTSDRLLQRLHLLRKSLPLLYQ